MKTLQSQEQEGDISEFEVKSISFDTVPEREFTLEAFGITNPNQSEAVNNILSPTWMMLIIGFVFVLIGTFTRIAKKRS